MTRDQAVDELATIAMLVEIIEDCIQATGVERTRALVEARELEWLFPTGLVARAIDVLRARRANGCN